jgi:signal peptidase I
LPGDKVELRDDRLLLNGVEAKYGQAVSASEPVGSETTFAVRTTERLANREHAVQFLPAVPALRNFGPVTVPPDTYFFLGDNRDNSADSRYIGFVPRQVMIGRAHHILVSADISGNWLPRLERVGSRIQ